jgi:hypothetical protein
MGPGLRRDDEMVRADDEVVMRASILPSHPFFPISTIACIAAM